MCLLAPGLILDTGALVGLGYDPSTGHALLPDHDSELMFEVEITQDDIIQVQMEL